MLTTSIFRGGTFTEEDIDAIRRIIAENRDKCRNYIAKIICEELSWYQPNGRTKHIACLEALRRMEKRGLITLPEKRKNGGYKEIIAVNRIDVHFNEPQEIITCSVEELDKLHIRAADSDRKEKLWRYLIQINLFSLKHLLMQKGLKELWTEQQTGFYLGKQREREERV